MDEKPHVLSDLDLIAVSLVEEPVNPDCRILGVYEP